MQYVVQYKTEGYFHNVKVPDSLHDKMGLDSADPKALKAKILD